uniref:HipA-like C-terminal domain-containing protein n=2 Tax=termite gut metagenome TaxID=433724 RepID=S0DG05_9ZZZZ
MTGGPVMQDFLLLSKDTPVAQIIGGVVQPIEPERLPLFLLRTGDVRAWLESRAIDGHRTNSRLLKRALRLEHKDDLTAVLAVNAATITDNYWVKPLEDEALRYTNVRFKVNMFDNLALTGDVNSFDQPPDRTPELTNTGSFEKCWRLEDGQWQMFKAGKPEELFSELLAFRLGKLLGFPMAEYEAAGDFIRSRDFTENAGVDFESAAGIVGDEPDYIKIYEALRTLGENLAGQYVKMCYLDGLIYNMDRHEHNFGVLRDSDTGEVLSLAPFFDHNIALIARGYPSRAPGDALITDFAELVRQIGAPLCVRRLTEQEVLAEALGIPFDPPATDAVPDPKAFTARYLISRQAALEEQCRGLLVFGNDRPSVLGQIRAAKNEQRACPPPTPGKPKSKTGPER